MKVQETEVSPEMLLRHYQDGDHVRCAQIFHDAVHGLACHFYTPAQCLAWAPHEINFEAWRHRSAWKRPLVIDIEGDIASFLEFDDDGHIDCAYTDPRYAGRGAMTMLLRYVIDLAKTLRKQRLYVDASWCIRPLFEKHGFIVLQQQEVERRGERITNFRMELILETKVPF